MKRSALENIIQNMRSWSVLQQSKSEHEHALDESGSSSMVEKQRKNPDSNAMRPQVRREPNCSHNSEKRSVLICRSNDSLPETSCWIFAQPPLQCLPLELYPYQLSYGAGLQSLQMKIDSATLILPLTHDVHDHGDDAGRF